MPDPSGSIALVLKSLREGLSQSATFQTLVDAEDAAEAKAWIHYERLPDPASDADSYTAAELDAYRPYAIVSFAPNSFRADLIAQSTFDARGRVLLELVREPDDSGGRAGADLDWLNVVGGIVDDLATLVETAGCLMFSRVEAVSGPGRAALDDSPGAGAEEQGVVLALSFGSSR